MLLREVEAFKSATHPHDTTHSRVAALVALRASSILNFFSFISTSDAAQTFITATHPSSFASLSISFSCSYFDSVFPMACLSSATLASISESFPVPHIIVVLFLFEIIFFALPKSSGVIFSSFIQSSAVITFAQVSIAISFTIDFLLSPNPGIFTASTFSTHLSLLRIMVVSASQSISSAIITRSFFPDCIRCSRSGRSSFILEILLSVMSIGALESVAVIFSVSSTIYGLRYH
jgi:hypothetical protein